MKGVDDVVLNGHGSAVTALRHNASGALLASGSKDTDVIVWDIAGEVGLYRFKGHRDQVCGTRIGKPLNLDPKINNSRHETRPSALQLP